MVTRVFDLLLATSVRAQQAVYDWADSAQSQVHASGPVPTGITMQCDWVEAGRDLIPKAEGLIGNLWGLLATFGGLLAIVLAIIIALLGKFAFGRRLTGLFLWIVVGLLAVGVVVQIIQTNVAVGCPV